ncbi:MAG: substrate-binding domain-containing protein [Hyphomicrobiales bacterium]|nr:substrate-binding domain-containing protein [Hyphomicrobiales bacterium]
MNVLKGMLAAGVLLGAFEANALARESIVLATTTSVENSGLLAYLLEQFRKESEVEVKVVARGTGQAFRIAQNGDADLVLAHHPASEEKFVAEGFGVARVPVMFNYFTLVGPRNDPAGAMNSNDAFAALSRIARAGETGAARFLSRGDESGTHRRERELWDGAGESVGAREQEWYLETGAGMGATLSIASELGAYTLTDRGTWLSFGNRGDLMALLEESEALFNPYSAILVDRERHGHVSDKAKEFLEWLTSPRGQESIASFRIDSQACFFPANVSSWDSFQPTAP